MRTRRTTAPRTHPRDRAGHPAPGRNLAARAGTGRQPPGARPAARPGLVTRARCRRAWGWKIPDAGRAPCVAPGLEYQATTTQLCGLYPFIAGSGTPTAGTPVGRHQLWGEVVCLDPLAWLRAGLVTNPGMFVLGQPGTGKSALVKRLVTGAVCFGTRVLVLGDTKPDYTRLVAHLGGQVIRIGRGLDTINPLDAGPLGAALARMTGPGAGRLRQELRSRRLSLLLALATLVREARISNAEEVILGRAIDLLDERLAGTRRTHRRRRAATSSRTARTRCAPPPAPTPRTATGSGSPTWCSPSICCAPGRWPGCSTAPPPSRSTWTPRRSASTSPRSRPPGTSC